MACSKVFLEEIKYPYSDIYDRGYIFYSDDGLDRTQVFLCEKNKKRFIPKTTYSRYLVETNLGRFLEKNEKVFHKDGNRLNHSIDNLEIKTIGLSSPIITKQSTKREEVIVELTCSYCKTKFKRPKRLLAKPAINRFCSPTCQHLFAQSAPKSSLFNMQSGF